MFGRSNQLLPIAVDIGTGIIKMLQLQRAGDQLCMRAAARFNIPHQMRRAEERHDVVVQAIRELLKNNRFEGRKALTVVPNHAIHFKSFRVPQMPPEELDEAVRFEAEERFAFDRPDAEYRYIDAGDVRQGQATRKEIIAMGCTRETLQHHLRIFDDLGLVCEATDVAPCAVVRCFERHSGKAAEERARMYADIGQHATRVTITSGGRICFIKSVAVGTSKLDEMTAMKLNLPTQEAVQLRREVLSHHAQTEAGKSKGLQPEIREAAFEAVRPAIEQLGKEIGLCLRYYAVTFRGVRPEELVCVGGESYDPRLRQTLSEITGVPAVAGSPLKYIEAAGVFSAAARRSGLLEWVTAAGLSLRHWTSDN